VLAFKTGSSFSAARYLNENLHLTLTVPIINGLVVSGAPNAPVFRPNTMAIAGVRAVASKPELRFVTYYSRLMRGEIVGSIVYNQARS
jgi:hypothetical protein